MWVFPLGRAGPAFAGCWLSSQRCLRIGINVSNPITIASPFEACLVVININMEKLEMDLCHQSNHRSLSMGAPLVLEMDLYATYLITRVHLLPRAAVSCAIVSNQACWLSSMPAGSSGSWLSSLLIVIIPDCHHCAQDHQAAVCWERHGFAIVFT